VKFVLSRVLQREPLPGEVSRGVEFIDNMCRRHKLSPRDALCRFALVAYNLNEFLYLD
jgi:hypothetical protein